MTSFQFDYFSAAAESDIGTLLHVACSYEQSTLVKLFLERDANPNARGLRNGVFPLHVSAERGDVESCALLISYGCTVDAVVPSVGGPTPLRHAILNREEDVVKFLVKKGADVNHKDSIGWTPLHQVCLKGSSSQTCRIAELLADYGADVNSLDFQRCTPLRIACQGFETSRLVKLLLKLGADATIADCNGKTPLYCAVTTWHGLKTARVIISNLLATTQRANDTCTLQKHLDLALDNCSLEVLSFMCAHGALETVEDHIKMKMATFATWGSIPYYHSEMSIPHSHSPGSASLYEAFQQAKKSRAVQSAIILASAGALKSAPRDVFADMVRFAKEESSVELALVALESFAFKVYDMDLFSDVVDLAVDEESTQLALEACRTAALPEGQTSLLRDH